MSSKRKTKEKNRSSELFCDGSSSSDSNSNIPPPKKKTISEIFQDYGVDYCSSDDENDFDLGPSDEDIDANDDDSEDNENDSDEIQVSDFLCNQFESEVDISLF